jgi:hypothetical protein
MASGAVAGAAVETALYPIDTIKTRLQAVRGGGAIVWGGLYSGLAGNIAGVIPASALFMGVYEPLKRAVLAEGHSPLTAQFVAATAAGTAASLVRVPTEVVKQRMQARATASQHQTGARVRSGSYVLTIPAAVSRADGAVQERYRGGAVHRGQGGRPPRPVRRLWVVHAA